MRFRKLRIAWSVAWGILAVLLCVLWVRSYKIADIVSGHITTFKTFSITSDKGRFLAWLNTAAPILRPPAHWHMTYVPGVVSWKLWTYGKLPVPYAGWYIHAPQGLFILLAAATRHNSVDIVA